MGAVWGGLIVDLQSEHGVGEEGGGSSWWTVKVRWGEGTLSLRPLADGDPEGVHRSGEDGG